MSTHHLTHELLRQIGEALHGEQWQSALSRDLGVSDRTMRRWATGADSIPEGVWMDLFSRTDERYVKLKRLMKAIEETVKHQDVTLHPIPHARPEYERMEGIKFAMRTSKEHIVRCLIQREYLDDLFDYLELRDAANLSLQFFRENAEAFYRIADRKFRTGTVASGLIVIDALDAIAEGLPSSRPQ